jgi:ferric-dicitrate binding protein FerR (iron transport regulator)
MHKQQWSPGAVSLLLALSAALGLLVGCGDTGGATASAAVVLIDNTAFACERTIGCATPAALGAQVFAGGEGRTGTPGRLDLQTRTTTFRLEDGATLQLQEVSNAVQRLVLKAGRLFADHDPNGKDLITVEAGTIRVDAVDSRFSMLMSGQTAYITVPNPTANKGRAPGQVTVSRGAAQVVLHAGEEITVPPGQNMPRVRPIRASEQANWDQLQNWPTRP